MSSYGNFPHTERYFTVAQGKSGVSAGEPFSGEPPWINLALADSRFGVSNPNWKEQVKAGRNATTPFTGTRQSISTSPYTSDTWWLTSWPEQPANWRRERKVWSHDVETMSYTLPPSSDLDLANLKAQTRFYKELAAALASFEGGVFLGELRETLQMIRNPARSLRRKIGDYLGALKKRRRGSPVTKKKVLADLWLEHSFGWLPLLHDLDAARNFHQKRVAILEKEFVPLQGSSVVETVTDTATAYSTGFRVVAGRLLTRNRSFARYLGACVSTASGTKVVTMSALGLSPRAFAPTLWELLPWSFVVDYFTNVGDVITAWSNQNAGLAWCCLTTRRTRQAASYGVRNGATNGAYAKIYLDTFIGGHSEASNSRVDRAPSSYVPVPSIHFEMPGFGKKWLNLAALAANRRALTPY